MPWSSEGTLGKPGLLPGKKILRPLPRGRGGLMLRLGAGCFCVDRWEW